jgi:hypothetical protein
MMCRKINYFRPSLIHRAVLGASLILVVGMLGLNIISDTITRILEDGESQTKEEEGDIKGVLLEAKSKGKAEDLERMHPLPPEDPVTPMPVKASLSRSSPHGKRGRFSSIEPRTLRRLKYASSVILFINAVILTPMSFTGVRWRNMSDGCSFIGFSFATLCAFLSAFTVFRQYVLLLKVLDKDASSQLKDHLKSSMRYSDYLS